MEELVFILDKSGSMSNLTSDVIGGFNSLIEKQKEEKDTLVTTVLFNDKLKVLYERKSINEVGLMTKKENFAEGCTALLDAIGNTLSRVKYKQDENNEKNKTIVVISTDGYENSSKEFSYEMINNLINNLKKDGYEFIFSAANIDSKSECSKLGIEEDSILDFECSKEGIELNYSMMENKISKIRNKK